MVNTRRLTQPPGEDDDADTSGTPMSAKQLRQIRKLTIDGESALGGAGTLKRRRTAGRSSLNPDTLSPAIVHDSPQTELSAAQPTPQSEPHQAHPSPMQHLSHSPAQRRLNNTTTAIDPTKSTIRMDPLPPRKQPPPREEHWFLPSDISRESSPKVVNEKSPSVVPPSTETAKAVALTSHTPPSQLPSIALEKEEPGAEDTHSKAKHRESLVAGPKAPVSKPGKGQTARRRSHLTKAERELRRLGVDHGQNAVVDSKENLTVPVEDPPSATLQQLETKHTTRGAGTTPVLPSLPLDNASPAVIRALKKLQIAANSTLSGVETKPQPQPGDRRSSRILRASGPSTARKQKPAPLVLAAQPRIEKRVQRFPKVPPEGLADHLLSLLATAADEHQIVRLLAGDARNAIMRDIRNEGFHSQQQRLQRELAAMQAWDVASESEATRLEAMFEANKENRNSGDTSVMTNGDLSCSVAPSVPDDLSSTTVLSHQSHLPDNNLADGSRRTSGSSQDGYFTASDAGSPQPNLVNTTTDGISRGKRRLSNDVVSLACDGEVVTPLSTETPESHHDSKRAKLSHESTDGNDMINGTERPKSPSDGEAPSDHDTPQDEQAPNFPDKQVTTRILSPEDDGTVPLDGWKGKHKDLAGNKVLT